MQSIKNIFRNTFQRAQTIEPSKVAYGALTVVNVACAVHLFLNHVGSISFVAGPSMLPTMSPSGEMVLESRLITPDSFKRGQLITYISPLNPSRIVCKRLIGLPGDIICVDPTGNVVPSTEHVVVPKGHLWLAGDNAEASRDSRMYGPVSMALVRGRLVAKVWPLRDAGFFKNTFEYID
ncbi:LexA/Signal peptidase [Abortiporus biennis]|nr:LexA/Signal peptidase [Abortiporus biennis]